LGFPGVPLFRDVDLREDPILWEIRKRNLGRPDFGWKPFLGKNWRFII